MKQKTQTNVPVRNFYLPMGLTKCRGNYQVNRVLCKMWVGRVTNRLIVTVCPGEVSIIYLRTNNFVELTLLFHLHLL